MEDPQWVAWILMPVVITAVGITIYREKLANRYKSQAHSMGVLMAKQFRDELHANYTTLYMSICIHGDSDMLGEKSGWLRIDRFRPWLIIEPRQAVDKTDLAEVVEDFVKDFRENCVIDVPFVRTTILEYATEAAGEV